MYKPKSLGYKLSKFNWDCNDGTSIKIDKNIIVFL